MEAAQAALEAKAKEKVILIHDLQPGVLEILRILISDLPLLLVG
jgi:hypothetical protein